MSHGKAFRHVWGFLSIILFILVVSLWIITTSAPWLKLGRGLCLFRKAIPSYIERDVMSREWRIPAVEHVVQGPELTFNPSLPCSSTRSIFNKLRFDDNDCLVSLFLLCCLHYSDQEVIVWQLYFNLLSPRRRGIFFLKNLVLKYRFYRV